MSSSPAVSRRVLLAGAGAAALAGVAACRTDTDETDARSTTGSSTGEPTSTERRPTTTVATGPATTGPATTTAVPSTPDAYFPPAAGAGEWATITAADAGYTEPGLADVVALVEGSNSQSLVVLSAGRIVAEHYWRGADEATTRDVASVQKSVVSTLVGMARDRGLLELDEPVSSFLGEGWSRAEPKDEAAISVLHLLTMTSGLSPRNLRSAAPPGTVWDYNTDAYQRLRLVLERAAELDINTITNEWLFVPIGSDSPTRWAARGAMTDSMGEPTWGLQLTAREMARFGLLAMRAGQWGDEQLTASDWFDEAWAPIEQNADYGYLWWLLGRGRAGQPGEFLDLVAALGAADQKIYVSPASDLVLARQGAAADGASEAQSDFDAALVTALSRARS